MVNRLNEKLEIIDQAPSLREVKRRRTSENIRNVAMTLFESRGYDQISIDEIARDAMVSPPTIFRYFDNKDRIVLLEIYDDLDWLVATLEADVSTTVFQALDKLNEIRCAQWALGSMRDRGTRLLLKSPSLRDALSRLEQRYRLAFIAPLEREFDGQCDGNMKAQITAAMLAGSTSALVELLATANQPQDVVKSASLFIRNTLKPLHLQ